MAVYTTTQSIPLKVIWTPSIPWKVIWAYMPRPSQRSQGASHESDQLVILDTRALKHSILKHFAIHTMSSPVTEIVVFPPTEAYVQDPVGTFAPLSEVFGKAPGFISVYHGVDYEDKSVAYAFVQWEKIEDHVAFTKSPGFPELQAAFKTVTPGLTKVTHVSAGQGLIDALSAPITEIGTMVLKAGHTQEQVSAQIDALCAAPSPAKGKTWNWTVEDPKELVLFVGWPSHEIHLQTRDNGPPEVKQVIGELAQHFDVKIANAKAGNGNGNSVYIMSGPVTEFVTFSPTEAYLKDPAGTFAPMGEIMRKHHGFVGVYHGVNHDDKSTGYAFVQWESIEDHIASTKLPEVVAQQAIFKEVWTSPPKATHVKVSGQKLVEALSASATEIGTLVLKAGHTEAQAAPYIDALCAVPTPATGKIWGSTVENPSELVLLIGWPSYESHVQLRDNAPPELKAVIGELVQHVDVKIVTAELVHFGK
ncbi:hypothetical protein EVG20_g447 [Dentipellis fragilis]|uniref:ABM domain-containing protein n=1 Tax=Dentipellis fragilis TaxID=205917 RepID=A0A4Y9ZGK8_9AGAM|nr:hypothetical protein EVG20_g447 [Dentipellis fragilis]